VLDDEHAVDDLPDIRALIERLIAQGPPRLHILIATRHRPQGVFLDPNLECHRLVVKGAPRDRVYFEGTK